MRTIASRPIFLLVAGAMILAGCRTYGDEGYDSGPKTYQALQKGIQQLDQALGRAQSDLRRLEAVADTSEALGPLAERYRNLVSSHETALEDHRQQVEALSAGSAYRSLHRSYGALVTDQRLLQRQYQRTVQAVYAAVRGEAPASTPAPLQSNYSITPVAFPRMGRGQGLSMAEALRGAAGTPGMQREEQTEETP